MWGASPYAICLPLCWHLPVVGYLQKDHLESIMGCSGHWTLQVPRIAWDFVFSTLVFFFFFFFFCFWTTSGSLQGLFLALLSNHSWLAGRPSGMLRIKPRSVACKTSYCCAISLPQTWSPLFGVCVFGPYSAVHPGPCIDFSCL